MSAVVDPPSELSVHVVHDHITVAGGGERVLEQLVRIWPRSKLFAPIADSRFVTAGLRTVPLTTSGLQRVYPGGDRYAHLLPLLPIAMAVHDVPPVDLVVASHYAFANRIRPPAGVPMISYTHSPARWMWEPALRAGEGNGVTRWGLASFCRTQRPFDRAAAGRPDVVVANSTAVADRVRRWWGRESVVVHPPVDVEWFHPDPGVPREDFFLLAGRQVPYKRPDVAVRAAGKAGVRLVVAGTGRELTSLARIAGHGVEFHPHVTDAELRDLYRRCRALVFPGVEDFGIVPVEAQACGTPVIAWGAGGALDTVVPGETGCLVEPSEHAVDAVAAALRSFDDHAYDAAVLRANAERFSAPRFRAEMRSLADQVVGGYRL